MKRIIAYLPILFVVLFVTSCSNDDYLNVIPKDVTVVASVDLAKMSKECDLGSSSVLDDLKKNMDGTVSKEGQKQAKKYLDDPQSTGIDFSAPIYMFIMQNYTGGMTMKVSDKDGLEQFLSFLQKEGMALKPVERYGIMMGSIFDDCDYAFTSSTFMLIAGTEGINRNGRRKLLARLSKLDKNDRFVGLPAYDRMKKNSDKDINIHMSLAALPFDKIPTLTPLLPKGVSAKDVEISSYLSFEDGRAVISNTIYGKSEKAQKVLEEADKHMRKLEGRYVSVPAEDFCVWMSLGVDGEWLLKECKKNESGRQMLLLLGQAIGVDEIMRSIDGDVTMTLNGNLLKQFVCGKFDLSLVARLKDTKFLDDVPDWQRSARDKGMNMTCTGGTNYFVESPQISFFWGVEDKDFYVTASKALYDNLKSKRSNVIASRLAEIKESQSYVYVNLDLLDYELDASEELKKRIKAFKALVIRSTSSTHSEFCLELRDKKINFLRQLVKG